MAPRTLIRDYGFAVALLLCVQQASAAIDKVQIGGPSVSRSAPVFQTQIVADDFSVDSRIAIRNEQAERFVRLDSNITRQVDQSGLRLRLGDTISYPGAWGNAVRFGGVQLGTTSAGAPVKRAVSSGDSEKPDCGEYSLGLGGARRQFGVVSDSYGSMFASGTVSCVVNDALKMELHTEHLSGQATTAGLGLTRSLGSIATTSIAVIRSQHSQGQGWQARFKVERDSEHLLLKLRARVATSEFKEANNISMPSHRVAPQWKASVGTPLRKNGSLTINYSNEAETMLLQSNAISLLHQFNLPGRQTWSLLAAKSVADAGLGFQVAYSRHLLH